MASHSSHDPKNGDAAASFCMTGKADVSKESVHAGDVTPKEAHDRLSSHEGVLVDVRTPEEWQAGVPDLKDSSGRLLTLSWKLSPNYERNPKFAEQFAAQGIGKDTPLFFMCRGGGRSLEAAKAMAQAGYNYCFNISGGFEGYKSCGLPWQQHRIMGKN